MKIFDIHLDLLYTIIHGIKRGASANLADYLGAFSSYEGIAANYYFEGGNSHEELIEVLTYIRLIQSSSPSINFIKSVDDIDRPGFKVVLCLEGLAPVESIDDIDLIFHSGVRQVSLTWNDVNRLAGGGISRVGLTELGKIAVKRFNELGGIIDLSHASHESCLDILQITDAVIASHSLSYFIYPHFRNLHDYVILKVKQKGGVIGLSPAYFIGGNRSLEVYLKHCVHIISLVGKEHIALSSDFLFILPDYTTPPVDWFAEFNDWSKVVGTISSLVCDKSFLSKNYLQFLRKHLLRNN